MWMVLRNALGLQPQEPTVLHVRRRRTSNRSWYETPDDKCDYLTAPKKQPAKPPGVSRCEECGRRLPEPITKQTTRFVYANPLLWSAFGASLIIGAIVFLDRYWPQQGLIWNAVNGKTAAIPTHYFVAAGALLFFLRLALAAKK